LQPQRVRDVAQPGSAARPRREGGRHTHRILVKMKFVVYVLFSETLNKYYVGQTQDLEIRLQTHNAKRVNFTSKGVPWKLVHVFECVDRSETVWLESKIKKRGIKRYLQDIGL
jgi:putative endonuclease